MSDSLLFALNDAARREPDILLRKLLRDAAIELRAAADAAAVDVTLDALRALNGAVARAMRLLDRTQGGDRPSSGGCLADPARLAA